MQTCSSETIDLQTQTAAHARDITGYVLESE